MGIKEKDLQTVESLQSGDKIRIVTGGGNSRNIDAGAVGGGLCTLTTTTEDSITIDTLDKSYDDLVDMLERGIIPFYIEQNQSDMSVWLLVECAYIFADQYNPETFSTKFKNINSGGSLHFHADDSTSFQQRNGGGK